MNENMHFLPGIFLPVEVNKVENTENCCCKCRGISKDCDEGGAWVYCDCLPILMLDKSFDETGEKDGCNNFKDKG